jgi:hypothetical protein
VNVGILMLLGIAFGSISAAMASKRNRNALAYGALGFCFFLPTVIALAVIGPAKPAWERD